MKRRWRVALDRTGPQWDRLVAVWTVGTGIFLSLSTFAAGHDMWDVAWACALAFLGSGAILTRFLTFRARAADVRAEASNLDLRLRLAHITSLLEDGDDGPRGPAAYLAVTQLVSAETLAAAESDPEVLRRLARDLDVTPVQTTEDSD